MSYATLDISSVANEFADIETGPKCSPVIKTSVSPMVGRFAYVLSADATVPGLITTFVMTGNSWRARLTSSVSTLLYEPTNDDIQNSISFPIPGTDVHFISVCALVTVQSIARYPFLCSAVEISRAYLILISEEGSDVGPNEVPVNTMGVPPDVDSMPLILLTLTPVMTGGS